jgi:hypothetical protein
MSEGPQLWWCQFTTTRILGATFWMAVCFFAYRITNPQPANEVLAFGAGWALLLSPFIAGGTLFGRPLLGAVVGIGLIAACTLVAFIALYLGWSPKI